MAAGGLAILTVLLEDFVYVPYCNWKEKRAELKRLKDEEKTAKKAATLAQARMLQATRDMVQAQQTQIGQLHNDLATVLSLVRAGGIFIPYSVTGQINIPPPTPPSDP